MVNNSGIRRNHKDANQKIYRSTDANGTVLGDGFLGVDWDKIETDADGKSVGLSAPITYPTDSNDLYTSGWSFGSLSNGQFMTYSVDGLHVPPEFVADRIGARIPGFELNLLEFSVTMSQRIREWRFIGQDGYDRTFAVGQVPQSAVDILNRGLATAYAILDNSWSAINLLNSDKFRKLTEEEIGTIREQLKTALNPEESKKTAEKCRSLLNKTLQKLGVGKLYKDIMDVFEAFAGKGAVWNTPIGWGHTPSPAASKRARLEVALERHKKKIQNGEWDADELVITVFHELLHGAGRTESFGHEDISNEIYKLAREMGYPEGEKLKSVSEGKDSNEMLQIDYAHSKRITDILKWACGGSKGWVLK